MPFVADHSYARSAIIINLFPRSGVFILLTAAEHEQTDDTQLFHAVCYCVLTR